MVRWQVSTVTAAVPVLKMSMHLTWPVIVAFPAARANPNTALTGSVYTSILLETWESNTCHTESFTEVKKCHLNV